jgi:DNA excision repair protein ERCC-2
MVSRELEKECIVVFDEAHNIDNVCIEVRSVLSHSAYVVTRMEGKRDADGLTCEKHYGQALSVNLRKQTLDGASRNISRLNAAIDRAKVVMQGQMQTNWLLVFWRPPCPAPCTWCDAGHGCAAIDR